MDIILKPRYTIILAFYSKQNEDSHLVIYIGEIPNISNFILEMF